MGARWNEAIGLRVCDVNLLRREIILGRQVINQNGTTTFVKIGSKTGDWRTLPVPQPVMEALNRHLARYCLNADREDLVFANAGGGPIPRGNFSRNVLVKAVVRAGLSGRRVTVGRGTQRAERNGRSRGMFGTPSVSSVATGSLALAGVVAGRGWDGQVGIQAPATRTSDPSLRRLAV